MLLVFLVIFPVWQGFQVGAPAPAPAPTPARQETEESEIDENDPDYIAARDRIEQLLDSMQPGIDTILSGINPNPPMV